MVAIFGGFTAKFSGGVILLLPPKNKSPTDRCTDRWGWVCVRASFEKGFGLRSLSSDTAEVAIICLANSKVSLRNLPIFPSIQHRPSLGRLRLLRELDHPISISFSLWSHSTFPENGELGSRRIDSLVLGERYSRRRAPRHKKSACCRRRSHASGPDSKEPGRLSAEPRWAWLR